MKKVRQIEIDSGFADYLDAMIKIADMLGADGCAEKLEYKGWIVRIALKRKNKHSNT